MTIDVLTLFPKMFHAVTSESIIRRAQQFKRIKLRIHNMRDYTTDKHRKVDDRPFGGGPGMLLQCQPVLDALADVKKLSQKARTILLTPQGSVFCQDKARLLSKEKALVLICGHYEGIDERIRASVDEEVSVGNYVLTGGELPAMIMIDAIVRLLPGVLGDQDSLGYETLTHGLLEYPQYTRPSMYKGQPVPDVLISGNHKAIDKWRRLSSVKKTLQARPELITHIEQLRV